MNDQQEEKEVLFENQNETLNLDTFPHDILLQILKKLNYKDLIKISQVNKQLNKISNDNLLWKMKLEIDINKWKIISSNNFPVELFSENSQILNDEISYKKLYLSCCPDVLTELEILKKLKTYNKQVDVINSEKAIADANPISSAVSMLSNLRDYIYNNIFPVNTNARMTPAQLGDIDGEGLPKLIMFGPGLETTTSCLVTNLLWKSEFQTIGMIPGKDGYGSGIKLKLFSHSPFNLTVLYTNVSQLRQYRGGNFEKNKLFVKKTTTTVEAGDETDEYEINPQVKDACRDASGYIYVIDNIALNEVLENENNNSDVVENYRQELFTLMRQCNDRLLPLLILSCRTEKINSSDDTVMNNKQFYDYGLSSAKIVDTFSLFKLKHEWQIRNCQIFQDKMKDIVLGFDWILNKVEEINSLKE
jgi:hypothetical protein